MSADSRPYLENFPPVFDGRSRILILGSMPGRASLEAGQYYAHPRNHFWRLMEDLLGISRDLDYESRLLALRARRVALWDSAWRCFRHASADSTMEEIRPSDFAWLFGEAPAIQAIFFNGRKSEEVFRRHALGGLPDRISALPMCYLPSTSPAHAGMSFEEKRKQWSRITEHL